AGDVGRGDGVRAEAEGVGREGGDAATVQVDGKAQDVGAILELHLAGRGAGAGRLGGDGGLEDGRLPEGGRRVERDDARRGERTDLVVDLLRARVEVRVAEVIDGERVQADREGAADRGRGLAAGEVERRRGAAVHAEVD